MELTNLAQMDIRGFTEELTKLEIKEFNVPKGLKIPNWPKAAGNLAIDFGKRDFILPVRTAKTGMLRLERKKKGIRFSIKEEGTFEVDFYSSGSLYTSGTLHHDNFSRIEALVLFHQFKEELFSEIIRRLRTDLGNHNQAVKMVREAIEPFVPFIVLDQLST